jgi:CheY-like chemotaxis protein/anti-sigma regulatory factor (Ser/Thr protein kinase)
MRLVDEALVDAVLTDLNLPDLSGLELIGTVRAKHASLAIIAMTAFGNEEMAVEALRKGASTYIPKRSFNGEVLNLLEEVLASTHEARIQERLHGCLTHIEVEYSLPNDETLVMPMVNHLLERVARHEICDPPTRVRLGIALREAIINAMEHGNLEVGSELRQNDEQDYHELVKQRRQEKPYCNRRVRVNARISHEEARFVIADEGPGFNRSLVADPTCPENLERPCGRGLLLIETFMDHVSHNPSGNQITMVKRRAAPAEPTAAK